MCIRDRVESSLLDSDSFLFESVPSEEELSPPLSDEELLSPSPPELEVELLLPPPEEDSPPSPPEEELGPEDEVDGEDDSLIP